MPMVAARSVTSSLPFQTSRFLPTARTVRRNSLATELGVCLETFLHRSAGSEKKVRRSRKGSEEALPDSQQVSGTFRRVLRSRNGRERTDVSGRHRGREDACEDGADFGDGKDRKRQVDGRSNRLSLAKMEARKLDPGTTPARDVFELDRAWSHLRWVRGWTGRSVGWGTWCVGDRTNPWPFPFDPEKLNPIVPVSDRARPGVAHVIRTGHPGLPTRPLDRQAGSPIQSESGGNPIGRSKGANLGHPTDQGVFGVRYGFTCRDRRVRSKGHPESKPKDQRHPSGGALLHVPWEGRPSTPKKDRGTRWKYLRSAKRNSRLPLSPVSNPSLGRVVDRTSPLQACRTQEGFQTFYRAPCPDPSGVGGFVALEQQVISFFVWIEQETSRQRWEKNSESLRGGIVPGGGPKGSRGRRWRGLEGCEEAVHNRRQNSTGYARVPLRIRDAQTAFDPTKQCIRGRGNLVSRIPARLVLTRLEPSSE